MLLGVDVGGTFTDAVLVADDGTAFTAKAPSTPGAQEQGVMAAVEAVFAAANGRPTRARGAHNSADHPTPPTHARGAHDSTDHPTPPTHAHEASDPADHPSSTSTSIARGFAEPAHPRLVTRFAHGMTVATNALIEGKVARTALVATDGFTDVVELGRQARPSLFDS